MAAPVLPVHPWTDVAQQSQWRLQRHSRGGYRIQTPSDRTVWQADVLAAAAENQWLETIKRNQLVWQPGPILVAIHGLGHHRRPLKPIVRYFQQHGYGNQNTVAFEYASSQKPVAAHAAALDEVLSRLPEGHPVDIVAHSLGNIVTRRWFGLRQQNKNQATIGPRRMVMLGPPNQGSRLAYKLGKLWLFQQVTGTCGQELGRSWQQVVRDLPPPDCPFGVIAATVPRWMINPLLPGAGDWLVRLDETMLAGATDTIVIPAVHSLMMRSSEVLAAVDHFLQHERFGIQNPSQKGNGKS